MKYFICISILLFMPLSAPAQVITGGVEKVETKDKITAYFSDGSFGIQYKNNPLTVLYYSEDGVLTHTEKRTSLEYPYKSYKYDTKGNLVVSTVRLSEDETLIYDKNGQMIAHWLGKNCYDHSGNIIMSRNISN